MVFMKRKVANIHGTSLLLLLFFLFSFTICSEVWKDLDKVAALKAWLLEVGISGFSIVMKRGVTLHVCTAPVDKDSMVRI